mmetsp:Transcript_9226/g.20838  ORF Transcript_9226/g.20838 Transcript_9226/m.20838 type:complete len:360 (-) Transcript_9226:179-1258(-)
MLPSSSFGPECSLPLCPSLLSAWESSSKSAASWTDETSQCPSAPCPWPASPRSREVRGASSSPRTPAEAYMASKSPSLSGSLSPWLLSSSSLPPSSSPSSSSSSSSKSEGEATSPAGFLSSTSPPSNPSYRTSYSSRHALPLPSSSSRFLGSTSTIRAPTTVAAYQLPSSAKSARTSAPTPNRGESPPRCSKGDSASFEARSSEAWSSGGGGVSGSSGSACDPWSDTSSASSGGGLPPGSSASEAWSSWGGGGVSGSSGSRPSGAAFSTAATAAAVRRRSVAPGPFPDRTCHRALRSARVNLGALGSFLLPLLWVAAAAAQPALAEALRALAGLNCRAGSPASSRKRSATAKSPGSRAA